MKYKSLIVLSAILLASQAAYGQAKTATGPPSAKKSNKKTEQPSDWSHFFQLFKFNDLGESKIQFETGLTAYAVSYDTWKFRRLEPFVKLRWAFLGKYLSLHTIFSTDFSSVDYELSHLEIGKTDVSFTAGMKSSGKHTFGGGAQILLFGWKKINLYGYAQTQSTSMSSASLQSAVLSINDKKMDLFEQIKDYVDITYTFERYDCGAIFSYQPLNWLTAQATAGYIFINADIKLALKQELADVLRVALGSYDKDVVPDRLSISKASAFGMLGIKFKLYKRLHLNLEGTILPDKHPVYYGQISFSIE